MAEAPVTLDTIPLPPEYGTEILRCEVGSTLHGTGLPGGEDRDEMGIYVEHPESVIGLGHRPHWIHRTAAKGERSQPGDTDLTMYSLRRWVELALKGNPSVIQMLYAPDPYLVSSSPLGRELRDCRHWFASRRAGGAFLGYMQQQRQRMIGERGRAGRVRVMPAGQIDWKYAMHMLRLGHQGEEFLTTGRLSLPVPGDLGDHLRAVRRGDLPIEDVVAEAEVQEAKVKALLDGGSPLRAEPNAKAAEEWMIDAHHRTWETEHVSS